MSETQRILTAAAFGLLGFAISIYTKQVIENRKPALDKLKCLGFYRSTQPTGTIGFIVKPENMFTL